MIIPTTKPAPPNDKTLYEGEDLRTFAFPVGFDHRKSAVPGNPCYNFRFRIFIFFTYVVVTQIAEIFATPQDSIVGVQDIGHQLTLPVNQLYHRYPWFASLIQLLSAFILDFTFFYVSLYWLLNTRNFRLFATLIIFYGVRALHLAIFKLQFAPNYYWKDPGIPSLVVKYGYCSDFFYSGHVGFLVIGALEMRRVAKPYMAALFFLCSFFQAFVVISFEIHYTIDVPAGYIFAHYFYNMVCYWEPKIDYFLMWVANILNRHQGKVRIENEPEQEKPQVP